MSENLVISENYCNFKVPKIKSLQKIIAMITEDKVTEIFCIADDFCKVFDAQMEKYTIKSNLKRKYHRESTMSKAEIMVIIILFHSSGFRCLKHFYKEYVPELVSWIVPLFVYAGTKESSFIRHLKVLLKEANVLWDGFSVLSFT